jgi:hypothetical protein
MTNEITTILSAIIGFGSTGITLFRWYRKYQRELFLQEREFIHLRNQSKQISLQLVDTDEKLDALTVTVVELRGAVGLVIKDFGVTNRAINLPTFGVIGETGGGKNHG